ncbi:MAG: thermonuclease family protein [Nitrospinae bacterium]|nr:thermonuclease family protein [Nitrospinota bacterium]
MIQPRTSRSILLLLMLMLVPEVGADIYTWTDQSGEAHFTDNDALVPPEYRDRVQSRPSTPPPEIPRSPLPPSIAKRDARVKGVSRRRLTRMVPVQVDAVLDGDTIAIHGGERVRYIGVNAPESKHPDKLPEYCGLEAFEVNRRLVAGKLVRLEFDQRARDHYGRLLAYVYVDTLFINAELVRLGYAQVSTYKENQRYYREFLRLQQQAIAARHGLWGGCTEVRIPESPAKLKARKSRKVTRHGPIQRP